MWKKISIAILSFISVFSVIYTLKGEIYAAEETTFKGSYIGRIGPAGDNKNISHFKKGDRILTGIKSPIGNDITWLLINDSTLWNTITSNGILYDVPEAVKGTSNGMYAMSYDEIMNTSIRDNTPAAKDILLMNDNENNLKPIYTVINNAIDASAIQKSYTLTHRKDPNTIYYGSGAYLFNFMNADYAALPESVVKYTFPQIYNEISTRANGVVSLYGDLNDADRIMGTVPKNYITGVINQTGDEASGRYVNTNGNFTVFASGEYNRVFPLRIPLLFNMSDVVFAMSNCQDCSIGTTQANVSSASMPSTYSSLYQEAGKFAPMKLRVKDDNNLGVSFDSMSIVGDPDSTGFARYIDQGDKVNIKYSGKKSVTANDYVSVLIEKKGTDGTYQLINYGQLSQSESAEVIVDTSNLALGDYRVSIVDETISEGNEATACSSMQSKDISVVNVTHKISYRAEENGIYEYLALAGGDKIGEITSKPKVAGASLRYELTSSGTDTTSYQNFEIEGLASGASASDKLSVKVKSDAVALNNGKLKPGTYDFCINSKTMAGEPAIPYSGLTQRCVSVKVKKATPTISFANTSTVQLAIGDADIPGELTSSNPNIGNDDITYELSNNGGGVVTIRKDTSNALKYYIEIAQTSSGTGLPATFTLRATIRESEYFDQATTETTRSILAYKRLSDLKWTPAKSEYYANNVATIGTTVGTLAAVNGAGPFVYELVDPTASDYNSVNGADNTSFRVENTQTNAGTTVDVTTAAVLGVGDYHLQFKVTDTRTNAYTYKTALLSVISKEQAPLIFKDSGGNDISSQAIKYNENNKFLLAEGGSETGNAIQYALAPQDMQDSGVNPSSIASIDPLSGRITPISVGKIKVQAKRLGDGVYDDKIAYMDLTINPAEQTLAFKNTNANFNVAVDKMIAGGADGKITIGGASGIGGITYSSNASNIASVNPTTGEITGIAKGSAIISATLNIKEGNVNYDARYETRTITKSVTVYTPMTFTWKDANPKVKANANSSGTSVGSISVENKFGAEPLQAAISTSTDPENADRDYFMDSPIVVGNEITLKLKKPIDAAAYASHNGGTFKVQVIITDGNGPQMYNVTVLIDAADNKVEFTDADGQIINQITRVYDDDENKFNLYSKSNSNSASESIIYSAKDRNQDILDIKATGDVNVLKTGSTIVKVHVGESNGYGEAEKEIQVTVAKATQKITFDNVRNPLKIELGGDSVSLHASGNVILSNGTQNPSVGDITYTSSDPSIVRIDQNGEATAVSMGSQIEIKAELNSSESPSYNPNYETVNCTKKIQVFTGKNVDFKARTPNQKAETEIKKQVVGVIETQNTLGPITYVKNDDGDSELFDIVDNGQSANVKFKDDAPIIKASDLFQHGNQYTFTVNVNDTNGSTPCTINIVIDDADDKIEFKKDGVAISKISEKFGVNGNEFDIHAVPKSGKTPTYKITGDKSIIEISDSATGKTMIKNAGTSKVEVNVPSGNGYAASTVSMDVEILKGDQWITFENNDDTHAFVKDETFSAKATLTEVSEANVSARFITYKSKTPSVCEVDDVGTILMNTTGNCTISVENKDANWTEAKQEKTIILYDGMNLTFKQDKNLQAETSSAVANSMVGTLKAMGGIGPIKYGVSTSTDVDNIDADFFRVNPNTGLVTLNSDITARQLIGKYVEEKDAYVLRVVFISTDKEGEVVTANTKEVLIKGAPLSDVAIDTQGKGKISKDYVEQDGEFPLDVINYHGSALITYRLKQQAGVPQDVISIDNGIVTILNANEPEKNPVIIEAIIPPSDGYDAKTMECIVEITQATQPFRFKSSLLDLPLESSVTLEIDGIKAKDESSNLLDWSMISKDTGKLSVSGHTATSKTMEGVVKLVASVGGDRNYKAATAEMDMNITSQPAYNFSISVPEVTYGDVFDDSHPLKPTIFIDQGVGTKTRTWESSKESVATIDENGIITVLKAGTTTISCTQYISGQPNVKSEAVMTVNRKAIQVDIEDATKYVGEAMPLFKANIPLDELVGSDSIEQPTFICKDGTTVVTADTKAGLYDIQGVFDASKYPNYDITISQNAKLEVKQDTSLVSWFSLEGALSKEIIDTTKWSNEDVNIRIDQAIGSAGSYDEISLDKRQWASKQTLSEEGVLAEDIYFHKSDSKALATPQSITLKIDKTKPKITSITGTPVKRDALSELLNSITFGKYFKPKLEVSIKAEEIIPEDGVETSGLNVIHYTVYSINEDSTLGEEIDKGNLQIDDTFKLNDEGKYLICATAEDHAGNLSNESCSGLRIQEIGDSSDGKDLPDINIDVDRDGVADINITRPQEKKPYLNIDSDGDGEPDINVSREGEVVIPGETQPYWNIISPATKWNPTKEVDRDLDGTFDYRTDNNLKAILFIDSNEDKIPDLNIDLNQDTIPEINIDANFDDTPETNIDSDGDQKADINIDLIGDGIATSRICSKVVWNPTSMVKEKGSILYATTPGLKPDSKESLNDNGVVVKPSNPDTIFLPNYALKVNDITKTLDEVTKKAIIEITGSETEIIGAYDITLLDGDKSIQPDGSILVRIPIDKNIKNPRVFLRNSSGKFVEVEANIEDGFCEFETDYLGQISIVGDKENIQDPSDPSTPKLDQGGQTSNPSVKGNYNGGTGGAFTGDVSLSSNVYIVSIFLSFAILTVMLYTKKRLVKDVKQKMMKR